MQAQPTLYVVAGAGEVPSPDSEHADYTGPAVRAERFVRADADHADAYPVAGKEDYNKFHDRFRASCIWAN
jgi:hypothetical protein